MALQSRLFRDDRRLQACLLQDSSHVTPGATGDHVGRIQAALALIEDARIARHEIRTKEYGPSTADAVLAYKRRRAIINTSYQTQADNIVGKMTIAALDKELLQIELTSTAYDNKCTFKRT